MTVSPGVEFEIMVAGGLEIVSTPLYWLLDGPGTGQLAAACVQGATGIVALVDRTRVFEPDPHPRVFGDRGSPTACGHASRAAKHGRIAASGYASGPWDR
ncbi:hypothetical protein [Streptomyces sp. NPDC002172]